MASAKPRYHFRCCLCGAEMDEPNPANQCINCLKSQVNLSVNTETEVVHNCRQCGRWEDAKRKWKVCEWESRQLLALVLKLIKGLHKKDAPELVNASFVWTEPHSKRIKIRLELEKEVMHGTRMQQAHVVEFTIRNLQCVDCKRVYTPHTWHTVVQVRQRCEHRRTFYQLEEMLLKNKATERLLKVENQPDGIDFFFASRTSAVRFVEFLKSWVVGKEKQSRRLVSHNIHNSTATCRHSIYLELCPVSRGDLVFLPKKTARILGGIPQLLLVIKVRSKIQLLDFQTGRIFEVSREQYWKNPFESCASKSQLREFLVMDDSNFPEITVAQPSDLGVLDECLTETRSHFLVEVCQEALGYDLVNSVIPILDDLKDKPDIILVQRKGGKTVLCTANGKPRMDTKAGGSTTLVSDDFDEEAEMPEQEEVEELLDFIATQKVDDEDANDPDEEFSG